MTKPNQKELIVLRTFLLGIREERRIITSRYSNHKKFHNILRNFLRGEGATKVNLFCFSEFTGYLNPCCHLKRFLADVSGLELIHLYQIMIYR